MGWRLCIGQPLCSIKILKVFLGRTFAGIMLLGLVIFLLIIDPIYWITRYMMRVDENSSVYAGFKTPDYVVHQSVYIFNYTNTERYIQGLDKKLKIEEVGPFVFQEISESLNMSIDRDKKVLRLTPNSSLVYLPELSMGSMRDIRIISPNLVMIVLGTLGADTLPAWSNSVVALIMRTVGSEPFMNVSVEELLWGYKDPLVDLASTYFPGWIDFSVVGILRMFYSGKPRELELELEGVRRFSIRNVGGSPGLKEQGYLGPETENSCNTLRGTYQGMLITPDFPRDEEIRLFKMQGCRTYPFSFVREGIHDIGVPYYRYFMPEDAYNASGVHACSCGTICAPDGMVDISKCYYGFPVYLSPPHFYSGDPSLLDSFEGLNQDAARAETFIDFDPKTGVPLHIRTTSQTNLRVEISPYNSAMKPFGSVKYLPVMWMALNTPYGPSDKVVRNLRLLHIHGPLMLTCSLVLLALLGLVLLGSSLFSFFRIRATQKRRENARIEREAIRELLNDKIKR